MRQWKHYSMSRINPIPPYPASIIVTIVFPLELCYDEFVKFYAWFVHKNIAPGSNDLLSPIRAYALEVAIAAKLSQ